MRIDRSFRITDDEAEYKRAWRAQAEQTATILCYFAECELATLEYYEMTKSAPKSQRERHRSICQQMVWQITDLGIIPVNGPMGPFPRLLKLVREQRKLRGLGDPE